MYSKNILGLSKDQLDRWKQHGATRRSLPQQRKLNEVLVDMAKDAVVRKVIFPLHTRAQRPEVRRNRNRASRLWKVMSFRVSGQRKGQ